jgi:hypothetical protein
MRGVQQSNAARRAASATAIPTQSTSPYVDKGGQEENATIKKCAYLGMNKVKV